MKQVHSIRFKLTLIMAAVVIAVIGLVFLLNTFVFPRYYRDNKIRQLEESYNEVCDAVAIYSEESEKSEENGGNGEGIAATDALLKLTQTVRSIFYRQNIEIVVFNSDWSVLCTTQMDFKEILRWYQNIIFNESYKENVIKEADSYTITSGFNDNDKMTFLTIYGSLDDGRQVMMQITVESIDQNVSIFNRFLIFAGAVVLIIAMIVVYFISASFSKPVRELSGIAESMSEMNFDVKYTGKDKGELGLLGSSMNTMSDRLEKQISEIKTANMKLREDIEIKNKSEERRREFLSNVSHELKTPIALISGYAEGLNEGMGDDPETRKYYCDVIIDEAGKMNDLVRKLMTLDELETGNADSMSVVRFDLYELASSLVKNFDLRAKQDNIRLVLDGSKGHFIWADQFQIEEVITNYMSNAFNHCKAGGDIIVKIYDGGLSVYNTGEHIPEEDIDRIWEKFYKTDKARTRQYGGNGIGLSIVKAILDRYNGEYGARNIEGGVEFYFILPENNEGGIITL